MRKFSGGRARSGCLAAWQPKHAAFKSKVPDAVDAALVASGMPITDRLWRVFQSAPEEFRLDPGYPDLQSPRDQDFVPIEIRLSVGRIVKVKRELFWGLLALLAAPGLNRECVMVVLEEKAGENKNRKALHLRKEKRRYQESGATSGSLTCPNTFNQRLPEKIEHSVVTGRTPQQHAHLRGLDSHLEV